MRGAALIALTVTLGALASPAVAAPKPDTIIDSAPPSVVTTASATFTFHSTITPATFTCRVDAGKQQACTSPITYNALQAGAHTFSVFATTSKSSDNTPATAQWSVDLAPPSVPSSLTATTQPGSTAVVLKWNASTDDTGVAGYDIFRGGSLLTSVGAVTGYTDTTTAAASTYQYAVRARDIAGRVSALSSPVTVTTVGPDDAALTRAPYLTDLVGLNATVNFGTDQSNGSASVRFGPVVNGVCSLNNTVAATATSIAVNLVAEYQWAATLTLPASGTYCYRPYLGGTDLLATNATPQFRTQVPRGSTESFSFAVFGDWGQVDANGNSADQANLMRQIASSGASFAVSVGDNGYPAGSQTNYGDLEQTGADTSAIFGPSFWPVPGASIPMFAASGNHGISSTTAGRSTEQVNWPETVAVATSGGRYVKETYCCVNGTQSASYPSSWYAFDVGTTRFYVLQADWADLNQGTGTSYSDDYAAHWTPSSPEYQWLSADLAAHPSGLKFAFFHYPLHSDQKQENSDTYLQGSASLEGLLAANHVSIGFNGHAHIYERNTPASSSQFPTYVTGGGGATLEPIGETACSRNDAYGIGWSPTNLVGTKCGGKTPVPDSAARVFHFLKVTVNGSKVTVTPTDELGRTFDVQTYTFAPLPDTYIDSAPASGPSSTATFAFHSSDPAASFRCALDAAVPSACKSPVTFNGLAQGTHTFTVSSTDSAGTDPKPATVSWSVDATPPTAPTTFTAAATSPFSAALQWSGASDNVGVTGYDVFRDGALLATVGAVSSYVDSSVLGGTTHQYSVRARDAAGNVSPQTTALSVTTPPPPTPVFADGFESGDLTKWTSAGGLVPETAVVRSGKTAVEGNTTNGATFARKTLGATYIDAYARVAFDVLSQADQIDLLRMRDAAGNSLGYVYLSPTGVLGFHDDATNTNTLSSVVPSPGWHALELHLGIGSGGATGTVEVWLDSAPVAELSTVAGIDVGTAAIGQFQIGEVQSGRVYDVVFDDAAFGTARLGPAGDATAPSAPADVIPTADSAFSVTVTWAASTDDVGVSEYDVYRDNALIGSVTGATTSYTDTTVMPSTTYAYTVIARDDVGNASAASASAPVTTPAGATPLFADGFESGDLSAWTSSAGLAIEGTDVRTGTDAAEGNTTTGNTFARKTLGASYSDAYARIGFEIKSQSAQVNLLRLRDAAGNSLGYVYVSASGVLGFHDDATNTNTLSSVVPGSGWHALELHMGIGSGGPTGTVEVWLDGVLVPALSSVGGLDVGTAPVGQLQIGEVQSGRIYDVVFDDAAFATGRIGP